MVLASLCNNIVDLTSVRHVKVIVRKYPNILLSFVLNHHWPSRNVDF